MKSLYCDGNCGCLAVSHNLQQCLGGSDSKVHTAQHWLASGCVYLKPAVWCKRSRHRGWSGCFWGVYAALNAFRGFYFGHELVSSCTLNIPLHVLQSSLKERYLKKCLLFGLQALLGATLGGAVAVGKVVIKVCNAILQTLPLQRDTAELSA